jgi:NitT/TauT family transport system permease protein
VLGRAVLSAVQSRLLTRTSLLAVGSALIVGVLWEILGRQQPLFASYPSAIAAAAVDLAFRDDRLVQALGSTLTGMAVGFAIATVAGVAIGLAMATIWLVDVVLDPYVNALYATPRVALIPLLVLWAGVGFELRVTVVVLSAIFPIIINVYAGVREVSPEYLDTARVFVASRRQTISTVVIPAALPFIFAGLRIGAARALTGITVAEMTAAVTGVGALLLTFSRTFATDRLFVVVVMIGILGILLGSGVQRLERRVIKGRRAR